MRSPWFGTSDRQQPAVGIEYNITATARTCWVGFTLTAVSQRSSKSSKLHLNHVHRDADEGLTDSVSPRKKTKIYPGIFPGGRLRRHAVGVDDALTEPRVSRRSRTCSSPDSIFS